MGGGDAPFIKPAQQVRREQRLAKQQSQQPRHNGEQGRRVMGHQGRSYAIVGSAVTGGLPAAPIPNAPVPLC